MTNRKLLLAAWIVSVVVAMVAGMSLDRNPDSSETLDRNPDSSETSEQSAGPGPPSEGDLQAFFALPSSRGQDKPVENGLIPWIDGLDRGDTLYLMLYVFTHNNLGDAVIRAIERSVDVRMLADRRQACTNSSEIHRISQQGGKVHLDVLSGLFHHKAAISGDVVWTGSLNWSASAQDDNYENVVRIEDNAMADRYRAMYRRMASWFKSFHGCDGKFPIPDESPS